jgi:predicted permease
MRDLKYAFRMLVKTPGFTITAALSIALAVGANATVFTWLKAVLLDPLPGVSHSSQLVTFTAAHGDQTGLSNNYEEYLYFRDHSAAFSGLVAHEMAFMNVSEGEKPELVAGGIASANYFDVLGVKPVLGRGFTAEECAVPGRNPVTVLSDALWNRKFHRDPKVLSQTVLINGPRFNIVGVAPAGFGGVYGGLGQELWIPAMMNTAVSADYDPQHVPVQLMGRLKPGFTFAQAEAETHVIAKQYADLHRESRTRWDEFVLPLSRAPRGIQSSIIPFVAVLLGVAGFVLLIACANVANLLLARSTARAPEVGLRLALGASRAQLIRQLLIESALLAAIGGLAGILMTFWTADTLRVLLPSIAGLSLNADLSVNAPVFLFSLALTLFTALLFGLAPAIQGSKADVSSLLNSTPRGSTQGRTFLRSGLVVFQVMLSLVALVGPGLFARSLQSALTADPGFNPRSVLLANLNPFLNGYDAARQAQFHHQLLERLENHPGVKSATLTGFVPLRQDRGGNSRRLSVDGYTPRADEVMNVVTDTAGPRFLETLQIPLVAGRDIGSQDNETSNPVVLVNETFAKRYWPGQLALGRHIQIGKTGREVVGVFRDFTYRELGEDAVPHVYVPLFQSYDPDQILLLRSTGDPALAAAWLRPEIRSIDPNLPIARLETLENSIGNSQGMVRMALELLASFSLIAVVLTAVGLYGVMAYSVGRRVREFGIRMALGAPASGVLGMVLRQGLTLVGLGILLGAAASLALGRLLTSLLYNTSASDPWTLGGVALILLAVTAAACYFPARRAAQIDPARALHYD